MVSDLSCNDVEAPFPKSRAVHEILRQYENGKLGRKLAELFYCGRTQINKIIREKDLILKEYKDFKFRGVKRMRHEKYVDINEAVLEWFKIVRAKKIPVSGPMIQPKAKELADALGIENFSASNRWRDRFRIWNNIIFRSLCGEAADVDLSLCEYWHWQEVMSSTSFGWI
ncbi:Tigger transposable element-derived protein 4 [Araneus ventricosus]|uniref:Tigger transposable element-derived protein 4 n=1 Tax=Araneus ventricosus TaxID=182803 RepID=A0A4Y2X144_ARAVE|nr:Tigger transposable element-derived protein 4 [Araneus ventricosus]